jgi:hypothetical protein
MDKALGQAVPKRFWVIDSPLGEESGLTPRLVRFFKRYRILQPILDQTAYEL